MIEQRCGMAFAAATMNDAPVGEVSSFLPGSGSEGSAGPTAETGGKWVPRALEFCFLLPFIDLCDGPSPASDLL